MITIKKPNIKDVKNIQEVLYKTWIATYPNSKVGITTEDIEEIFKDRFSEQNIQKRTNNILDNSENKLFLVAKNRAFVVGICRAIKKENNNQLQAIYVLPDHQRRGIGKMFWSKVVEFFGNEKNIIVQVASYNTQAIGFYKKLGFIDTGKRFANKHQMPLSGKFIPEMELIIKAVK